MNRLRGGVIVWIVAAASSASAAQPPCIDLAATIGEARMTIRLCASIDGQPLASAWDEFAFRLFHELDRDGDGSLSRVESQRAPSVSWLGNVTRGDFVDVPARAHVAADFFGNSSAIGPDAFAAAYRAAGPMEIDVRIVPARRDDGMNRSLFEALAGGEDQVLNEASFGDAGVSLRRFDVDDDERISEEELLAYGGGLQEEAAPEMALRAERFHVEAEPGVVVTCSFVELRPLSFAVAPNEEAGVSAIAISGAAGLGGVRFQSAREQLRQQLEGDDVDGDETLDEAERLASPSADMWQAITIMADQNEDRRLTIDECERWLDLFDDAAWLRIEAVAADEGHPLFLRLDADDDGRLTPRELRSGWLAVKCFDADGDGNLTWAEVPRRLNIVLSRGPATSAERQPSSTPLPSAGPKWLQHMDRNGDGDVSRREFLGPLEVFERLDADHDDLLDVAEASRGP